MPENTKLLSTSPVLHRLFWYNVYMYQYIFTGSNWKTCITFSLPFMALGKGKMIKNILVTPNTVCTDKKPYKYGASRVEYYQMQ